MRADKNTYFLSNTIYGLKATIFSAFLVAGLSWVIYQILENYSSKFAFMHSYDKRQIYLLSSSLTKKKYELYGLSINAYIQRKEQFKNSMQDRGFSINQIKETDLADLERNSILIVLDAIALSKNSLKNIKTFVKEGGFLIFNYNFAFNIDDKFQGSKNIEEITSLKHIKEPYLVKQHSLFIVNRLLSPLSSPKFTGKRVSFKSYDPLYLYSSKEIKPDIYLTNWELTKAQIDGTYNLKANDAGVAWHGHYGEGNWIYFSFASYIFFESNAFNNYFGDILSSSIDYATKRVSVRAFPYLDQISAVLLTEDTEYKFSEFKNFIELADTEHTPLTAFCVSSLAQKHPKLMKKAQKSRYVEVASHSHTHKLIKGTSEKNMLLEIRESKKILNQLSESDIVGFRPPREQLDEQMNKIISQSGYKYILENVKNRTYPSLKDGVYHIPRLGSDDYEFMVRDSFKGKNILQKIEKETDFVTSIDGIYNFDIHTHLLGYGKNIDILKNYISYIKKETNLKILSAKDIVSRISKVKNIEIEAEVTPKNYLVTVKNLNQTSINNFHFRLYWPDDTGINSINSEIIGAEVSYVSNKSRHYSDVTIKVLAPLSPMTLIVSYGKSRK